MIPRLCAADREYQYVNPTTQVALFSACQSACTTINNVTWRIYEGVMDLPNQLVQWTLSSQMSQKENIWFFGQLFTFRQRTKALLSSS